MEERLPIEDTFGDILRKAMRGRRRSVEQLAAATGLAPGDLSEWLADRGSGDEPACVALARALALDAGKLLESAQDAWYPDEPSDPRIRRHSQHPHPSNGYVYALPGGEAALVDPAGDPAHLLRVLRDGGYALRYVLITHKHDDHCDAAGPVAAAYPDATFVMHPLDVHAIGNLASAAIAARDGARLEFGGDGIAVLHTPGHTDGSVCYRIGDAIFTGDTLFAGSVGGAFGDRTTYADLLHSVATKLWTLPRETAMQPGHGPAATLGQARAHNPFFA